MSYVQIRIPNPLVPCIPGWCLKYVQDVFSIGALYPSASAAWNASQYKHADQNFPEGCAVAVWFSIPSVPEGHVAVRMPDGTIYSSSSPTSTSPTHHASLSALIQYYGGLNLTYLGWTEDVEDTLVIQKEDTNAMNEEAAKDLWRGLLFREPDDDQVWRPWLGKPADQGMRSFMDSVEWQVKRDQIANYPALSTKVADLTTQLTDANAIIATLQSQPVVVAAPVTLEPEIETPTVTTAPAAAVTPEVALPEITPASPPVAIYSAVKLPFWQQLINWFKP
ncbi:hypothetical protein [Subtercola sp. RTI3]|uniref:hypothetical protein n=1 Tax=Subtercola sp. RTI3 TaxID=3048639 RepID=UPI002B23549E|nr:hypothetical protein [Subtercola sp. RTI3]MEA9986265.1 hypothetical protein [Subtercola sp. RTI3]